MLWIETAIWVFLIYLGLGFVLSLPFVFKWVDQLDPGAKGAKWGFRLIILPASMALWPLWLLRLRKQQVPHQYPRRVVALKKRHKYVWATLAVLVPLLFTAAWYQIPDYVVEQGWEAGESVDKGEAVLIGSLTPQSPVALYRQTDTLHILQIKWRDPLETPSALVFLTEEKPLLIPTSSFVLGTLGTRGDYEYPVADAGRRWVTLFDPVKEKMILQCQLN